MLSLIIHINDIPNKQCIVQIHKIISLSFLGLPCRHPLHLSQFKASSSYSNWVCYNDWDCTMMKPRGQNAVSSSIDNVMQSELSKWIHGDMIIPEIIKLSTSPSIFISSMFSPKTSIPRLKKKKKKAMFHAPSYTCTYYY